MKTDGNPAEITGGPTVRIQVPVGADEFFAKTSKGGPWKGTFFGLKPGTVNDLNKDRWENRRLQACTVGTATSPEPGIQFDLGSLKQIDADYWDTLTFEYSYEGLFSARSVPGGGMYARVFWTDKKGRHPTNAIHLYPNENIVQVRLNDPATEFQGIEKGKGKATGAPWAGVVTGFRLNPNDDKGSRCFTIGRVWLTASLFSPSSARLGVDNDNMIILTSVHDDNSPIQKVPSSRTLAERLRGRKSKNKAK